MIDKLKIKGYNLNDTIAAIATFPSRSALGIIKLSGKQSLAIIKKIFKPARNKNISKVQTHTLHYGWIVDKQIRIKDKGKRKKEKRERGKEKVVDEVLVSVMRRPHSYTREDVVEISSHGGAVVLSSILELLLETGARLSLPGEFTYRAFLNGRIDLLQAEGILNIVEAKTTESLELAVSQLKGGTSRKLIELKQEIKELFIETESVINFPESEAEISYPKLSKRITEIRIKVDKFLKGSRKARYIRKGFRCVICGKANAGKSTLFNCLLQEERVITSRKKGTTRDVIESEIDIRGIPLKIYDTAGILEPSDIITRQALKKTFQVFAEADLVILMLDASRRLGKDDFFLLDKIKDKSVILLVNKIDIAKKEVLEQISGVKNKKIRISALKNIGLGDLEKMIYNKVYKQGFEPENVLFLNYYQQEVLEKLKQKLERISLFLKQKYTIDFVDLMLKDCLDDLSRMCGEVVPEEVLEKIFSRFCIGK